MENFITKVKKLVQENEIAKLVIILPIITGVTALLLAAVNAFTAPVIFEREQQATFDAMRTFITEADDFELTEFNQEEHPLVSQYFIAKKGNDTVGYTVKVAPNGYGGAIEMIVSFDAEGAIVGTNVITMSETSNIGTKILEDSFKNQFIGKMDASEAYDTISGATISSKAYISGINAAVLFLAANK